MTLSSLNSIIADMDRQGIVVWVHLEPARVRVVLQNTHYKLAKAALPWSEVEERLPGMIERLAAGLKS